MRAVGVLGVVVLALASCDGASIAERPSAHLEAPVATPPEAATPASTGALDDLPWADRIGIERAMAESDVRHAPRMDETGPVLGTSSALVTFSGGTAHLDLGGHRATLAVAAIGRGETRREVMGGAVTLAGPEVRSARGEGVVEWWRSLPSGLEHGVNVAARPAGEGELVVEITVGALAPRARSEDEIDMVDAAGNVVATYAHLWVIDAAGAHVPARMSADGDRIVIAVDDSGARYPLIIDPVLTTVHEATLVATTPVPGAQFGGCVFLSRDGSRAIVGVQYDTVAGLSGAGTARVFVRTGATWAQEATLSPPAPAALLGFGSSVALSADGTRALVGSTAGAWVFVRARTTWTLEASLPGSASGTSYGYGIALSGDGVRAVVGAYGDTNARGVRTGSAWVFVRTRTSWAHETTLFATGGAADDYFGYTVAITEDGSRVLVGAMFDDTPGGTDTGSARVFLRTGSSWAEEATLLAATPGMTDWFGYSLGFDDTGTRAIVGATEDDVAGATAAGSADLFLREGTRWAHEATLLDPGGDASARFGHGVALSGDGTVAIAGAPTAAMGGRARLFVRTGVAWAHEGTLVHPTAAGGDYFGKSVALSADGTRGIVGAYFDDFGSVERPGSAHVFTTVLGSVNGTTCTTGASCRSDFCIDGVCCDTTCGRGSNDCQACTAALTGGADGTCAPIAADTVCRAAASECDAAEACNGRSVACPADRPAARGTECRAAAGDCDLAEACNGERFTCPADRLSARGSSCRASSGSCDSEETCDGLDADCPADAFLSADVVCREAVGPCDLADHCDGASAVCIDVLATGTTCRLAITDCDVAEVCDGVVAECPGDGFVAAGTECGTPSSDVCDAPDVCSGSSAECIATFAPGVVCRPSAGDCDVAEVCADASGVCPPDVLAASGVVCRASTATCDPAESCDGAEAACPEDESTCAMPSDAGPVPDAGLPDASSGDGGSADASTSDAGAFDAGGSVGSTGCACAVGEHGGARLPLAMSLALMLVALARRRRR